MPGSRWPRIRTSRHQPAWYEATARRRDPRRVRFVRVVAAIGVTAAAALGASSWVVSLAGGSSAQGQSATVAGVSINAIASPSATNLLYPGTAGDAVIRITNTNAVPVTITAVQLPTSTTYATGYSNSGLTSAQSGCTSSTSDVSWSFATGTSGSSHTLSTSLTVAAGGTLTVTLTDDVSMSAGAPAACENAYFSLPALVGITATAGAATPTTSPAIDAWTS